VWGGGAGARQGARPVEAVAGQRLLCETGSGWRAWAVREGVGGRGKEGSWAGPERNSGIFDLVKRILKGNDWIQLKDGLHEF
jgi:hypothetical protein